MINKSDKDTITEFNLRLKKMETEHRIFEKDIKKLREKVRSMNQVSKKPKSKTSNKKNIIDDNVKESLETKDNTNIVIVKEAKNEKPLVVIKKDASLEELDKTIADLETQLVKKLAESGLKKTGDSSLKKL